LPAPDVDDLGSAILVETRRRVSRLAALERQLEDRIRSRWQEVEAEAQRQRTRVEEECAAHRKRLEAEAKERWLRAEKEGKAQGFREGFGRGRDEGYRLGVEEGRRDGQQEGYQSAARSVEAQTASAAQALAAAAAELAEKRAQLIAGARRDLVELAMELARKLVKREVAAVGDVALRNIGQAIELTVRRGALVIQVSPEDAPAIERALAQAPRWREGFEQVEVRPSPDIGRGGCRLVSGPGSVDMTLETQMALLEEVVREALEAAGDQEEHASAAPWTTEDAP
jgi:flagellar assembly protein FliH